MEGLNYVEFNRDTKEYKDRVKKLIYEYAKETYKDDRKYKDTFIKEILQDIENWNTFMILVVFNQEVIGFCSYYSYVVFKNHRILSHIYVKPEYRNKGIARNLVDQVSVYLLTKRLAVINNSEGYVFWLNIGFENSMIKNKENQVVLLRNKEYFLHIATENNWEKAKEEGSYKTNSFIKCTTNESVLKNLKEYKNTKEKYVLLVVNSNRLKSNVEWKNYDNVNAQYPCVYGEINLDSVEQVVNLNKNRDGDFYLPDEFELYGRNYYKTISNYLLRYELSYFTPVIISSTLLSALGVALIATFSNENYNFFTDITSIIITVLTCGIIWRLILNLNRMKKKGRERFGFNYNINMLHDEFELSVSHPYSNFWITVLIFIVLGSLLFLVIYFICI